METHFKNIDEKTHDIKAYNNKNYKSSTLHNRYTEKTQPKEI